MPSTLADALAATPRPLITYYDVGTGERVELSGVTVANWVAKVANFLLEECDAGPGTRVRIGLPSHWQRFVWLLGAWRVGAVVTDHDADIGLSGPDLVATEPIRLASALRPLGGRFVDEPAGFIDIAIAVPAMPDVFIDLDPPSAQDPALDLNGVRATHASLLAGPRSGERLLRTPASVAEDAQALVAALLGGGSIVVASGADADSLAALAAQEQARLD